ncbi:hypothetical protein AAG570_014101 [Ranatra chinensis]|uniref:C2H2-type domain-containing protein n=1 Tax=Ranatra chinensis TaxID=642074 RepID=A0ABD0XRZ1_9HEMI
MIDMLEEAAHRRHSLVGDMMRALLTEQIPRPPSLQPACSRDSREKGFGHNCRSSGAGRPRPAAARPAGGAGGILDSRRCGDGGPRQRRRPFRAKRPERDMPRLGVENKLWQCGLCPKSFSSENFLHFHMWEHMPFARKMVVPLEQNGSPTHGNMYRHKLYHSSSQCLCQVCGRVYPTRSTLRAHQITHSNLRPHKCSLCDKTFKRNQDLKFHINQHTGERPYRCPYCPKAFASSGNCFSHRKRMHPKQLARDKNKLLSTRH